MPQLLTIINTTLRKSLIVSLFLFLLSTSCKKGHSTDCFKSNGPDITEFRYPGDFKNIELHSQMDVYIYQGNEYKVEVTAGKHIIKNIKTTVTNNLLSIENTSVCNFVRGYKRKVKINITVPFVSKIFNYSVSPIIFDSNFRQDSTLNVRAESSGDTYINGAFNEVITSSHGNGDVYLSGSSKTLLMYSNGTNYTHAENFRVTEKVFISTYSIADAYFNLEGLSRFEYYIWSEGNIYYTGTPQTIANLGEGKADGKGLLIKQD